GSKNPGYEGWQKRRLTKGDLEGNFPTGRENIGLLLGEPSGGLVDVDLDASEAGTAAPLLLPAPRTVSGRARTPPPHSRYNVSDPPKKASEEYTDIKKGQKYNKDMLVELRSTGGQTVVPPSRHQDTGELIVWHEDGEPAPVHPADLRQAVRAVAAAALLAR